MYVGVWGRKGRLCFVVLMSGCGRTVPDVGVPPDLARFFFLQLINAVVRVALSLTLGARAPPRSLSVWPFAYA
jgi:hypothetical protein